MLISVIIVVISAHRAEPGRAVPPTGHFLLPPLKQEVRRRDAPGALATAAHPQKGNIFLDD